VKDGPEEHVNQEQYNVITDLEAHPKFGEMVASASTCYNDNMKKFCCEHVFFEKRRTGDGFVHHLPEVPQTGLSFRAQKRRRPGTR